jgi:bisanhydrobacterioruberin hydratase
MKDYSKFLWITAVALVIVAFFLAKVPIKPEMAPISGVFIIFLALPSYYAMIRWVGLRKTLIVLTVLSIYAISIETIALITGVPYSQFHYTDLIGLKIWGYTPYTVPFAYVPLFLGCIYLASVKFGDKIKIILFSTFLVLAADLMLDPAAVALKFWVYETPGFFYGVPLMNFLGWIVTGFIASLITVILLKNEISDTHKPKAIVSSLFLILSFWSSVCIYMGLFIPGIIGFALILYILWQTRFRVGEF